MSSTAKKLLIAAAVVIFGAVLLLGGLYVYTTDFSFRRQPFSAETWRAGDANVRGSMLDDLLHKDLLLGHASSEVIGLLGPPDSTTDPWFRGAHYLTYKVFVGKKLGSSPWPHYLHMVLSQPDDKVEKVYVAD